MDTTLPIPAEQSPSETRQSSRMAEIPELYRQKHERLAVELALGMDNAGAIFATYGYDPEQAADLIESPAFITLLERVTRDVRENGLSFKAKIKAVAEELIPTAFDLATDPLVSSAVRKDIIVWAAKLAGHEPKETKDDGKTSGGFTLSIQFAGAAPTQIISAHEPLTIEQE